MTLLNTGLRSKLLLLLAICAFVTVGETSAQERKPLNQASGGKVIDYMVATVNGSLITYSDVLWQLTLEPGTVLDRPSADELRRALELIIRQRIIYQDAEKLPHIHATDKETEAALLEFVRLFPSQAALQQRMQSSGLTSEKLREIIRERVDTEKYLDFRFRAFTVVSPKEIEEYYRDVYVPRFRVRSPQQIVPTLAQVRTTIEKALEESKVEASLQEYLDEARERADIVILTPFQQDSQKDFERLRDARQASASGRSFTIPPLGRMSDRLVDKFRGHRWIRQELFLSKDMNRGIQS